MLNAKDSAEVMVNGYSHNNVTFRCADRKDVSLILHFIKKLAAYEKVPEAVHATEELLEEWMFEKNRAEAIFAMVDGTEVRFVFFYQTFPNLKIPTLNLHCSPIRINLKSVRKTIWFAKIVFFQKTYPFTSDLV